MEGTGGERRKVGKARGCALQKIPKICSDFHDLCSVNLNAFVLSPELKGH